MGIFGGLLCYLLGFLKPPGFSLLGKKGKKVRCATCARYEGKRRRRKGGFGKNLEVLGQDSRIKEYHEDSQQVLGLRHDFRSLDLHFISLHDRNMVFLQHGRVCSHGEQTKSLLRPRQRKI